MPDTFSPTYTLEAFLGTPLNDELKSSLSQILSPEFTGIEHVPDKRRSRRRGARKEASSAVADGEGCSKKASSTSSSGMDVARTGNSRPLNVGNVDKDGTAAGKDARKDMSSVEGKEKEDVMESRNSCSGGAGEELAVKGKNDDDKSSMSAEPEASKEAELTVTPLTYKNKWKKDPNRVLEVLECPECGMHTEIPDGNISFIPYNFFVQHIMDLMTYYSSADPVPLVYCSLCRKDGVEELPPAVARCSTCAAFLCKQCFELHSIDDFTKLHTTLTITERGESSMFSCLTPGNVKVRSCKFHNHSLYVYYCITCGRGICETCSKRDHKAHLFTRPEGIRPEFVTYIRDLMGRTSQLRRRTEGAVKTTQDLMGGIQLLAATQIEEVLRTQDVLIGTLDMRLNVMMMEVDKAAKEPQLPPLKSLKDLVSVDEQS